MLNNEIIDPLFDVEFLSGSKQENPDQAIWEAMHQCLSDGSMKSNSMYTINPVEAVIKNALKFKHWAVLRHGYIGLQFTGFPHSVAMQLRTHGGLAILCQSMRYTGDRFIECADGVEEVENLFYLRNPTEAKYFNCFNSCVAYRDAISQGESKESSRDLLASGYRQNFTISGNFQEWMHMFDQRLLADAQLEVRQAAEMALGLLCSYSEFFTWYGATRAGKNQLAP